mmetsp:Transcript_2290/g.7237  ORF Transcript_2290/g.7237 Transcript_2290/m.7237 type:complete len:323 (+) Transcript_2290:2-970(+)
MLRRKDDGRTDSNLSLQLDLRHLVTFVLIVVHGATAQGVCCDSHKHEKQLAPTDRRSNCWAAKGGDGDGCQVGGRQRHERCRHELIQDCKPVVHLLQACLSQRTNLCPRRCQCAFQHGTNRVTGRVGRQRGNLLGCNVNERLYRPQRHTDKVAHKLVAEQRNEPHGSSPCLTFTRLRQLRQRANQHTTNNRLDEPPLISGQHNSFLRAKLAGCLVLSVRQREPVERGNPALFGKGNELLSCRVQLRAPRRHEKAHRRDAQVDICPQNAGEAEVGSPRDESRRPHELARPKGEQHAKAQKDLGFRRNDKPIRRGSRPRAVVVH